MGRIAELMQTMEYGPSPEADDAVRGWLKGHGDGFGHFIAGKFTPPGELFDVFEPARGQRIARVTQGTAADVDAAVAAARKALGPWSALPGSERARALYALARLIQKRERFLSVLEIHRQRQADPRDARCRYSAGRAPFLPPRRLGLADRQRVPRRETGRRLRPDHPLEFSAADACLEDRAGAGLRQYGRAEAGRIHAADGARLRRDLRRGGPARPASSTSSPATARRAPSSVFTKASTKSPSPARPKSAA